MTPQMVFCGTTQCIMGDTGYDCRCGYLLSIMSMTVDSIRGNRGWPVGLLVSTGRVAGLHCLCIWCSDVFPRGQLQWRLINYALSHYWDVGVTTKCRPQDGAKHWSCSALSLEVLLM